MIKFQCMKQAHKPKDYVIICNSHHFQDNSNNWASYYLNIYTLICVHLTMPSVAEFVQHGGMISTYIHTYIVTYTYIHTDRHTDIHTCISTCICINIHAYIHMYMHVYIHMYTNAHIYIHIHHMHVCTYYHVFRESESLPK
jgi:hypothetical protein